jgi:hypothetical protein
LVSSEKLMGARWTKLYENENYTGLLMNFSIISMRRIDSNF